MILYSGGSKSLEYTFKRGDRSKHVGSKVTHRELGKVGPCQRTQNIEIFFHMWEDHILNANLRVKLVIPFIFTSIQRVKTCLFDKSNRVCLMYRWFVYCVTAL